MKGKGREREVKGSEGEAEREGSEGEGEGEGEVANVTIYAERDHATSLDMQWRNSLADCLD